MELQYRTLCVDELNRELFKNFIRHQKVTDCWRREKGTWVIKSAPFIDDWSEGDYQTLVACLKNTLLTGGFVYAAFWDGQLKGFVSVESTLFGGSQKYLDLTSIHVSEDMRGHGIGKKLFYAAKKWASQNGAKKLYISAHSAVESQSFYKAMGCVEAQVYNQMHVEAEPNDCQLECELCQPNELLENLDRLHTTELGAGRIKKNLSLDTDDVVAWCKAKIRSDNAVIKRNGKNWYVDVDECIITVNAYSYTIITAHREKKSDSHIFS